MRAVVQRVSSAGVDVDGEQVSRIGHGLMVLLGVEEGDTDKDMDYICQKLVNLRVFEDDEDVMNLSITDVKGEFLIVSQFTLLGDARKGRRPSYIKAEKPERANEMYMRTCDTIRALGFQVAQGIFQTDMKVSIVNDGPVTILLDSRKAF